MVFLRPFSVVDSEFIEDRTPSIAWVVALARVRKTEALSSSAR